MGGGTGGHIYPVLEEYKKFLKEKVVLIGSDYRGAFFFKSLNQNDVIVLKTGSKAVSRLEQFISFPLIIIQALVFYQIKQVDYIFFQKQYNVEIKNTYQYMRLVRIWTLVVRE